MDPSVLWGTMLFGSLNAGVAGKVTEIRAGIAAPVESTGVLIVIEPDKG